MYGRNIFESLEIAPLNNLLKAMDKGAKLTYIDPRVSVTATKADRYWMIRPGTDLALNYALIHTILKEKLYDQDFVHRWVSGLDELTGLCGALHSGMGCGRNGHPGRGDRGPGPGGGEVKPAVVFHYGYRGAHHPNEIYFRRSLIILNALMGSIEAPGGLFIKKGPKAAGRGDIGKYVAPGFPQNHCPPV